MFILIPAVPALILSSDYKSISAHLPHSRQLGEMSHVLIFPNMKAKNNKHKEKLCQKD